MLTCGAEKGREGHMPFVKTNGVDLYYEVHGQGPALVLAHPGGGNHLSWWQQVPVFARTFTCITFDHRGHGDSCPFVNLH